MFNGNARANIVTWVYPATARGPTDYRSTRFSARHSTEAGNDARERRLVGAFTRRILELEVSYNAIAAAGLRQIHRLVRET
jgi:hypothetical protein